MNERAVLALDPAKLGGMTKTPASIGPRTAFRAAVPQVLHCLQSKADVYAEDNLGQSFLAAPLR